MTNFPFEAVGYRVIVEVASALDSDELFKAATEARIVIPDEIKKKEQYGSDKGVVISIGPIAWADKPGDPWVKVGDSIYFERYVGIQPEDFRIDDKIYRTINDIDIFARVKEINREDR